MKLLEYRILKSLPAMLSDFLSPVTAKANANSAVKHFNLGAIKNVTLILSISLNVQHYQASGNFTTSRNIWREFTDWHLTPKLNYYSNAIYVFKHTSLKNALSDTWFTSIQSEHTKKSSNVKKKLTTCRKNQLCAICATINIHACHHYGFTREMRILVKKDQFSATCVTSLYQARSWWDLTWNTFTVMKKEKCGEFSWSSANFVIVWLEIWRGIWAFSTLVRSKCGIETST